MAKRSSERQSAINENGSENAKNMAKIEIEETENNEERIEESRKSAGENRRKPAAEENKAKIGEWRNSGENG